MDAASRSNVSCLEWVLLQPFISDETSFTIAYHTYRCSREKLFIAVTGEVMFDITLFRMNSINISLRIHFP